MLSCKDISHLSSELIDENLSLSMRLKIKLHLFMCHKCRNFIKQMRTTVDTVKRIKPEQPKEEEVNQQVEILINTAKKLDATKHK